MKRLAVLVLLVCTPAWGQVSNPYPKDMKEENTFKEPGAEVPIGVGVGVPRPCQPIGRTAKGELVYSMDCQKIPEQK
jgi:hypothetical protein